MIDFNEAAIRKFVVHRISIEQDKSMLSDTVFDTKDEEHNETLKRIFLKPFQSLISTYEFKHEIDLSLNALLKIAKNIFADDDFLSKTKNIHQHLKAVSKHPNIKDGDLFVIKFDDILFNGELYQGLGIYKVENKESFIETSTAKDEVGINFRKGIGSKKPDKACLILFTDEPYTLFVIDNAGNETDYWQNEFLKAGLKNDYVNNTNQFLTMAKSFVTDHFAHDFEVTKADQIDLLNRSVDYFKKHDTFDKKEFEEEVLFHATVIDSFSKFDGNYRQQNNLDIADNFEISPEAVKKQSRVFKSVLKLDKNFHIYIHGSRELIEQGMDDDGRKFYKIYYQEES